MKREGAYVVPFGFEELSYERAVTIAADTGKIVGEAGPLLETVIDMLDELDRPDEYFDCIQVAGTNGKTSTTRFTAAILRGEGLRTALYTSPQLVRYEERMEVDGGVVSPSAFAHGVSAAAESGRRVNERRAASGEPTYTITPFDLLTAAAMVVFAEARVDVAVLEVGLGGRWDATSATDPVAVAITGIGLDHTHILGDTLEEIAEREGRRHQARSHGRARRGHARAERRARDARTLRCLRCRTLGCEAYGRRIARGHRRHGFVFDRDRSCHVRGLNAQTRLPTAERRLCHSAGGRVSGPPARCVRARRLSRVLSYTGSFRRGPR